MARLPEVADEPSLRAVREESRALVDAVADVAARHGARGAVEPAGSGSFPVFFVGGGHVVKLVPARWKAKLEAEVAATRHVRAACLAIPVPAVEGNGEIDGWGYAVLTRLGGRALGSVWPDLSPAQQAEVMVEIGAMLAELHRLPVPAVPSLAVDWPAFIHGQRDSAVARHAKGGAPPAWLAAIPELLAGALPEIARSRAHVLLHADVHHEHVLLDDDARVCGLLDFGDAFVGDPAYDLVTPVVFLARGRAELLAALLDGYGVAPAARTPALRRRLMAFELVHRFAQLPRDVGMLGLTATPATLAEVEAALLPALA
jgi:hygromycin-B 7''-O-kinase